MARSSLYNLLFRKNGMKGGKPFENNIVDLLHDKKEFLLLVFSNLVVQLGITYYVIMNYADNHAEKSILRHFMIFLLLIVLIFVMTLVDMPMWCKFIVFSFFSSVFGVYLSSMKTHVDPKIIQMAVAGTVGIFSTLLLFGVFLVAIGIRLGMQFGLFLLGALLLLIISQIVMLFIGASSMWIKMVSIVGLFIFSMYVVYDTNNILQRDYSGDFITASLDYYLDILNLFLNLTNTMDN